jgi:hypothetical protein
MRLFRVLPIAAADRPHDLALRERLEVIGDLPYSLFEHARQLGGRGELDGPGQVGEEDPPPHRVADGADQL